jgi:hypothetical protein
MAVPGALVIKILNSKGRKLLGTLGGREIRLVLEFLYKKQH